MNVVLLILIAGTRYLVCTFLPVWYQYDQHGILHCSRCPLSLLLQCSVCAVSKFCGHRRTYIISLKDWRIGSDTALLLCVVICAVGVCTVWLLCVYVDVKNNGFKIQCEQHTRSHITHTIRTYRVCQINDPLHDRENGTSSDVRLFVSQHLHKASFLEFVFFVIYRL